MLDGRFLDTAAALLDNAVVDRRCVRGTHDGRAVELCSVFGTVSIAVSLDVRDLLLEIDPRVTDDPARVLTGDAAFDAAFHVEGAPADVVIAALADDVRTHLLAFPHCAVELADGMLVERHRDLDVAQLAPCLRAVISLARHIERARPPVPDAALELAPLGEIEASRIGYVLPVSMVLAGAAYVAVLFAAGLPLVFLLLAVPAALIGGLVLSLVLSPLARVLTRRRPSTRASSSSMP